MAGVSLAARNGRGRQVAQDKLGRAEIELQHLRVPKDIGIVGDRAIEDPAPSVVPHPGQGIVLIRPHVEGLFRQCRFLRVNAEQHAHPVSGVRVVHTEELATVLEVLGGEGLEQRMAWIVELDDDVLVRRQMVRTAPPSMRPNSGQSSFARASA